MPNMHYDNIAVEGISCAVPKNIIQVTDFYSKFGKSEVDDFINMTGVHEFHATPEEQTASDLCYAAAENLITNKKIDREVIGALVFVSQTPDYRLPATACVLHHRLGLSKDCMAFDVNLGCSGWVYGINIVASLMQGNDVDTAILLFGDTSIKTASPEDRSSIMLFGEAGSATLLQKKQGHVLDGAFKTDGNGFKAIIMPSGAFRNRNGNTKRRMCADGIIRSDFDGYMNGTDVFSFTISEVPRMIKEYMEIHGTRPEDYDALILHQANLLILKQIAKKTKFSMDKIPITLDRFGNTSGTSIPITLCDTYGRQKEGKINPLMCGFGIGLSWGIVGTELDASDILPIIETEEYFRDGGISYD